jgi:hypothetical protein
MAAIPISISGVLYDKTARTQQSVYIIGSAQIVGLSVGGGPIIPPDEASPPEIGGGPIIPPGGGGGQPPHPEHPIWGPPGINFPDKPGYPPTVGGGPIIPPDQPPLPPEMTEPNPGDPTTILPPPAGSPGWPVQPITPPPYIVVNYPGVGPVVVAPPAHDESSPPPQG